MDRVVVISGMKNVPTSCSRCPFREDGTQDHPSSCSVKYAVSRDYTTWSPDISSCPLKVVSLESETERSHWRKI